MNKSILSACLACLLPVCSLQGAPSAALVSPDGANDPALKDAVVLLGENKLEQAEQAFRKYLELHPEAYRAQLGLADIAAKRGNVAKAEELLRDAVLRSPDAAPAWVSLGRLLYSKKEYAECETALITALRLKPVAYVFRDLGTLYAEGLQRHVEALDNLYKAAELEPEHAGTHYALGQLLVKMEQPDQARMEYLQAARLEPKNPLPWLGLARLQAKQKNVQSAGDAFRKAAQVSGYAPEILLEHADFCLASGQKEEARMLYVRATETAPNESSVWMRYAMYLHATGDLPKADEAYGKTLSLAPKTPLALNNRAALALAGQGEKVRAVALAREAVRLVPENSVYLDTLGELLRVSGSQTEAKLVLEKAAKAKPEYPTSKYHLARLLAEAGEKHRARQELGLALASKTVFPERAEAEQLMSKLGN